MRQRWHSFLHVLERRVRYRVTRGGIAFLIALALIALSAFATANNLLFLVLAAMLGTLLVSGVLGSLSLAGLEVDCVAPEHVFAGLGFAAQMRVRNVKWLMPSFSIRVEGIADTGGARFESAVYFPMIPAGATLEKTVEARFARRGAYRENGFAFSTAFPFGFLRKTARVTLRRETLVYPPFDPLPGFEQLLPAIEEEMEAYYRGLGRDFYRIRPYEALESARHVDWRATAHTGSLQVREFARDQDPLIAIFLDLQAGLDQRPWFECAVEACACLAWQMTARGARIHFRTQDWEILTPLEGDVYAILRYLALVEARGRAIPLQHDLDPAAAIVFTAQPGRLEALAWSSARILHPGCFPPPGGSRADSAPRPS